MTPGWVMELFAVLAFAGGCFCAGVAWAAYRAVGWVERIHAWAEEVSELDKDSGVRS